MTEKKIIKTEKACLPIGPYNQAVQVGNILHTSGQIPMDPQTGEIVQGNVEEQTRMVFQNLQGILEAAGSGLDKVVKTTVFLKDMNTFPEVNEVYGSYFEEEKAPARSCVEVARLPKDVLVEIEAIATV